MHLASGGPKSHLDTAYGTKLTREILVNNTKIINTNNDPFRIQIMEALLIKQNKPSINSQVKGSHRTLKLQ